MVDMRAPMDRKTCSIVHDALHHMMTLLHHLVGPQRMPLFSLSVLASYPEVCASVMPSATCMHSERLSDEKKRIGHVCVHVVGLRVFCLCACNQNVLCYVCLCVYV